MGTDPEFRFSMPLRVRWAECDPQGVVFNATYLAYCDHALTEYFRAIGVPYREYVAAGHDMVLVTTTVDYHAPARPDDDLTILCRIGDFGDTSWSMWVVARNGETPVMSARSRYVTVDGAGRKQTTPDLLRDAVARFEAGQPPDGRGVIASQRVDAPSPKSS
ncbi:MAG TPA: thioesterase family protein [Candidatus Dormibacteraeota bacterium]|nr:thioesterase family protein [Candidatus Dormibacteraeota bacterium]